jgi:hypothetical protein
MLHEEAALTAARFGDFYWLENYLFSQVSPRFSETHSLSDFDFFCIVIWKANRAKSRIARGLVGAGFTDLQSAVNAVARDISSASDSKERLRVLIQKWGFRLPMASAMLTVLYPDEFTVYDVRVCESIGDFGNVQNKVNFDALWDGYRAFLARVRQVAPGGLSLRDKDRWLWGKSFADQLQADIRTCFAAVRDVDIDNDA